MSAKKDPITGLTPKQEKFAQEVAKGSNFSDAYRASYNVRKSTNKSVNEKASELMANINVSSRVNDLRAKLRAKVEEEFTISKAQVLKKMAEIMEMPDKHSAGVSAAALISKMLGYDAPAKIEHSGGASPIAYKDVTVKEKVLRHLTDEQLEIIATGDHTTGY